jgi:Amt family ammonium transporter
MQPAHLSEMQALACVLFLTIAPLSWAGLALINAGLGRSRNAAHSMMAALCVVAVAACMYFVCGRAFQGYSGAPGHSFSIAAKAGTKVWDWLGAEPLFLRGLPVSAPDENGLRMLLEAWFGIVAAALTAMIPLGSGSDRWRLGAVCASAAALSGFAFPLFAHWAWGGGWLAQAGANFGLGRGYLDAGGSGPIHALGGLSALAMTWIIGARRGKYSSEGMPMAIPGHNAVVVLFGCMAAFVGWLGLNCAGAILFTGIDIARMPIIAMNTLLSAGSASLCAALITRVRFTKTDASLSANGWVGGLVASSAGCAFLPPAAAIIVGLVAGALVIASVDLLDLKLEIDDPSGAISAHAVAGIWGVLAVGFFGRFEAGVTGQILAQLAGVASLVGCIFPLIYGMNLLLNSVLPHRVPAEGEQQGMDLYDLGAGAYPEFVTHTDDFIR